MLLLILGIPAVLAGCSRSAGTPVPEPQQMPEETRRVSVFFSTGRSLLEEYRLIDNKKDLYEGTLQELMSAAPESNPDVAVVQPETKFRSVSVKDGVLTVDWERDVLDFEAEPKEKVLALAAILRTFGEFKEIKKVRFTVEGKTKGRIGGKDVESFWGRVSLKGQPWPVMRPKEPSKKK